MKYSFLAVFSVDKYDAKWINVVFPDLPGAVTCGVGREDAMFMAKDLLRTIIEENIIDISIVKPSSEKTIRELYPDGDIVTITYDSDSGVRRE